MPLPYPVPDRSGARRLLRGGAAAGGEGDQSHRCLPLLGESAGRRVMKKTAPFLAAGVLGLTSLLLGQAIDFYLHAADPTLTHREGLFNVTNPGHVLLGLGLVLVVVGVLGAAYTYFPLGSWGRRAFLAGFVALAITSGITAGLAAPIGPAAHH